MHTVNMLEAKSNLSRLIKILEYRKEREIIIARNGRPVAKLVSMETLTHDQRIGVAKGAFEVPDNIDAYDEEVAKLFLGGTF
ncbi:type II toxin-antitoxin system Phd/YefM family antitoxin [Candidatus Regiella endosymbiont of Tuberolachnus salignus]|uniref:type II toxin-antitoxin system Phd/YefM family antitoxin n=1 Tax=Candidatus Regiella endosymbiont of Tuberolachnus salignus TaxID=3077956 RepID=UPI0030CB8253